MEKRAEWAALTSAAHFPISGRHPAIENCSIHVLAEYCLHPITYRLFLLGVRSSSRDESGAELRAEQTLAVVEGGGGGGEAGAAQVQAAVTLQERSGTKKAFRESKKSAIHPRFCAPRRR